MFQALLEKRAHHRATHHAYQKAVDDCLAGLFRGFPDGVLPTLRQRAGNGGLVRQGEAEGTDPRICAVQMAVLLIRKLIGPLSTQERQDLARAFLRNDASNPTYKGLRSMLCAVERLEISPALVSYLNTEVAGQLRGMSQQAIFGSWVEAQIGGVMGRMKQPSIEEAELEADFWQ
jgi:hypothetical protein